MQLPVICIILFNLINSGGPLGLNTSQDIVSPVQPLGCPSPQPFIQNTNSSAAFLRGNIFNGTQPEDAGIYTCFADGLPRAAVEVIVLCTFIYPLICIYFF